MSIFEQAAYHAAIGVKICNRKYCVEENLSKWQYLVKLLGLICKYCAKIRIVCSSFFKYVCFSNILCILMGLRYSICEAFLGNLKTPFCCTVSYVLSLKWSSNFQIHTYVTFL